MKHFIYADNAATTKLDKDAFNAMLPWLQEEYGNASQLYSFARKPKKALMEARTLIAECIGAQPDEIYFTSGGTESDNWAIKGIAEIGKKHHTITTQIEHHAILNACRRLEHFGFQVDYLPVDKQGVVSCDDLVKFIKSKIDFIRNGSNNHVPGNINLSIRGMSGEMLLHRLDLMGICISTGSACDSVNTEISHVIKAIGVPSEYSEGTIRISFGRDNTEEDAIMIAKVLAKVIKG